MVQVHTKLHISFLLVFRLLEVIHSRKQLMCKSKRLLKLFEVLCYYNNTKQDTSFQPLKDLFWAIYTELSFPDQDSVVMEIHCVRKTDVRGIFVDDFMNNTTNLFNRVSAEIDSQVCY